MSAAFCRFTAIDGNAKNDAASSIVPVSAGEPSAAIFHQRIALRLFVTMVCTAQTNPLRATADWNVVSPTSILLALSSCGAIAVLAGDCHGSVVKGPTGFSVLPSSR